MKIPDPVMKLAILTVHCDKVTKELNAKQPSILFGHTPKLRKLISG